MEALLTPPETGASTSFKSLPSTTTFAELNCFLSMEPTENNIYWSYQKGKKKNIELKSEEITQHPSNKGKSSNHPGV